MANFVSIEAAARERAGKGAARATRRAGLVPAVIYGAKQAPTLIQLDPKLILRELQRGGWRSRLYEVSVTGQPGAAETTRALIRDVQFHPVSDRPEHVDFQRLAAGEPVRVSVSVRFTGELTSPGLKRGGMLNVVRHSVEVLADPDHVPEHFDVDLSGLDINDNLRWSDLPVPEGVRPVIADRDFVIATVVAPTKSAEPAAAEGAAPAAPAAKGGGKPGGKPAAKPAAKK